jgi:hypothetical protein
LFYTELPTKAKRPAYPLEWVWFGRVCSCLWSDRKALYLGCFVFLFYTESLLEILHSSFLLELPRLFVVVESSSPGSLLLDLLKKNCSFAWCCSSPSVLLSVLVCVISFLHLVLLLVVWVVLLSSPLLLPWRVLLFLCVPCYCSLFSFLVVLILLSLFLLVL